MPFVEGDTDKGDGTGEQKSSDMFLLRVTGEREMK